MKLIIEITFPPNASKDGIERLKKTLPDALRHDLILLANAEVPEAEQHQGDAEVSVVVA
jgi:hypothetical protein